MPKRMRKGINIQGLVVEVYPKKSTPQPIMAKLPTATSLLLNLSPSQPRLRRPGILISGIALATRLDIDLLMLTLQVSAKYQNVALLRVDFPPTWVSEAWVIPPSLRSIVRLSASP